MEGRQDRLWGWPIFRFLKIWRQASLSYRQRLRVNGSRVYPQIIFDTLLFLSEKVLTVHVATENEKSRALPERFGFTEEGILRQAEWLYDHYVDHIVYRLLREEWE